MQNKIILKNIDKNDSADEESIKRLLKRNIELTEEILKKTRYVRRFVIWQQVFGVLKILIIVAPIVLGIIYIPQFIEDLKSNPKNLLEKTGIQTVINSITDSVTSRFNLNSSNIKGIDSQNIPKECLEYLK